MKIKRKPPGRPWHRASGSSKVCLLCLRRYDELRPGNDSSFSEEESEEDSDPLAESPEKTGGPPTTVKTNQNEGRPAGKKKKRNVYLRFLTMLSRYLSIRTARFRKAAVKNHLPPPFCDKCKETVSKVCNQYDEFNKAKLGLYWRLFQVGDTIKSSKVRVSGKLSHGLIKSLSTHLHVTSSRVVEVLRMHTSQKCCSNADSMSPRVSISRNSCLNAMKHKLKFKVDQMQQYLMSLIAVFTLAVPPKKVALKKLKPVANHTLNVNKKQKPSTAGIKTEPGAALMSGNIVKTEPKALGGEESIAGEGDQDYGDNGYSPPNSGPASPIGNNSDNENDNNNGEGNDSDWSAHAGGPASPDDSGSDVEFSIKAPFARRWNLRKRKTTTKQESGANDSEDEDNTLELPPLRAPRGCGLQQRRHIDESEKKYSCNLCSQKFVLERTLKRHLGLAHAFIMQYNCTRCNLKFRKQKDLILHKKKVHRGPNFKPGDQLPYMGVATPCTVCQKIFPSKVKMMIHRKTHKIMEQIFTCEKCGKTVRGKFRYEFHLKTHDRADKPHRCTKCPRAFSTKEGLDVHIKLHEQNPDWVPGTRKKKKKSEVVPREGIYKCDVEGCDKSFYKQTNLTVHMSLHAKSFTCEVCSKVLLMPRDLRRHLNKLHETENKFYFCLHCDKTYTLLQSYDLHKKTAHPSKAKLPCDDDYCTEEFDTTEELLEHLKSVHVTDQNSKTDDAGNSSEGGTTEKNTSTTEEDANINTTDTAKDDGKELKEESDDVKLGIYTCERCKWSFCRKLHLTLHLLIHTPRGEKNAYKCPECDKTFPVVDSLQTHYNRIHGPKIKPYLCLQCGQRFHRKESFIPHLRMHKDRQSTTGSFDCTECKHKSSDRASLAKHSRTHEVRQCDKCEEQFPTRLGLLNHQHIAHGVEKPYKCDVEGCGKGFFSLYQMNDHKICHTEGTLQCPFCPKVFRRRHNLDDHILVHKQEKNHVCDFCGKAFVKKSSLGLHLAIHRGEKKYKCTYCGKAFCRKFALQCHIRTHTKEKPFTCDICGRPFGQYTSLKNHLKVHQKLNSTVVVRRPFKKTLGLGKPLQQGTTTNTEPDESYTNSSITSTGEKASDPTAQTDSGIIHEALRAAFDDINVELELPVIKIDGESDETHPQAHEVKQDVKEEDEVIEEEEVDEVPVKRKRKRRKNSKDFICGICGKAFVREKMYSAHVERHLSVDALLGESGNATGTSINQDSRHGINDTRAQPALNMEVKPLEVSVDNSDMMMCSVSVTQGNTINSSPSINTDTTAITRRNPRRSASGSNKTPGSRLARIVEDVMEAATSNQVRSTAVTSISSSPVQYQFSHTQAQQHLTVHQQQQHHQVQSPPHQMQSSSERSTPVSNSGSPASSAVMSQPPTTLPVNASSYLSPFLYANPYLLPREDHQMSNSQHQPQTNQQTFLAFANAQHNRQLQQQQIFSHGQSSSVPYGQNQLQNYQLQQASSSTNAAPQDLSKSSYSMFYANPR